MFPSSLAIYSYVHLKHISDHKDKWIIRHLFETYIEVKIVRIVNREIKQFSIILILGEVGSSSPLGVAGGEVLMIFREKEFSETHMGA